MHTNDNEIEKFSFGSMPQVKFNIVVVICSYLRKQRTSNIYSELTYLAKTSLGWIKCLDFCQSELSWSTAEILSKVVAAALQDMYFCEQSFRVYFCRDNSQMMGLKQSNLQFSLPNVFLCPMKASDSRHHDTTHPSWQEK